MGRYSTNNGYDMFDIPRSEIKFECGADFLRNFFPPTHVLTAHVQVVVLLALSRISSHMVFICHRAISIVSSEHLGVQKHQTVLEVQCRGMFQLSFWFSISECGKQPLKSCVVFAFGCFVEI